MLHDAPVLTPATVDDVRSAMRDAMRDETPLQIRGAGTWRAASAPIAAARALSLAALRGIIAYVPGDLTITAWAGTSLAEIANETAAHGQWIGLDPAGDRHGTIGATIATASSGPLAHAFGTPRDLVLGLDAVTGYGESVRPGGRVVKNVAGFDLVRLYTGSWGTLGAITSVTLRLRALPVHDVTLAITGFETTRLSPLLGALRANTLSLLACEFVDGGTAKTLGISNGGDALLLRLGGNDAFIRGQRAVVDGIAPSRVVDPAVWGAFARLDHEAHAVVRISGAVSTLAQRVARIQVAAQQCGADVSLHACVSRGIVRVIARGDVEPLRDVLCAAIPGEQRIVERLPHSWWSDEADPFSGALAGRVRDAFDPHRLCNRRERADA